MAGYGSDADFVQWAQDNGYFSQPTGLLPIAVLRQRGSTYIDATYADRFVGSKSGGYAQERQWPRTGAYVGCNSIPDNVIPIDVIHSSYEAALQEMREPESLSLFGSAIDQVKREKVGPIEVEYKTASEGGLTEAMTPLLSLVEGMLKPYLIDKNLMRVGLCVLGV